MSDTMEFVITADDRLASSALDRVRSGLNSIERAAVEGARRASNALDAMARAALKVGEVAGALYVAKKAFGEFVSGADASVSANGRVARATEATVDSLRVLRVAYAAATGSRAALFASVGTVGAGIAIEEAIRITKRYGDELVAISVKAAKTKTDLQDTFTLVKADKILGGNALSPLLGKFDTAQIRAYIEEVRKIQDPYLQARRAVELFGSDATLALGLLKRPTEQAIDAAVELGATLDGKTRASVLNFQRTMDNMGGFIDAAKFKLRQLAEEAKQGVAVTVAVAFTSAQRGVADFLNRGGPSGPLGPRGAEATPIPGLAEIIRSATTRAEGDQAVLPANANDPRFRAANAAEQALKAEGQRAVAAVRAFQSSIDGLRDQLSAARKSRDILFQKIEQGGPSAALFAGGALQAQSRVNLLEAQIKRAEAVQEAEKRTSDLLQDAQNKELKGMDLIEAKRRENLKLYGLTADQIARINEQAQILLNIESTKLNRDLFGGLADRLRTDRRAEGVRFAEERNREIQFQDETEALRNNTARNAFRFEQELARDSRDAQLRQLEFADVRTIQAKVVLEQQKAAIEEQSLLKMFALKAELLDRDLKQEIENEEKKARMRGASEAEIQARRDEVIRASGERGRQLQIETQSAIDANRENSAIRVATAVRDNNQRVFDGLKRSAEGVFDALVSRSKSWGRDIANAITTPILTGFKEIVSTQAARLLFPLFGGGNLTGGGRGVSGGGGLFGQMLGLGGGFGIPGAPGGTSGFAGPVSLPGLTGIGLGGFGIPGAPGGTGGFAGPVGNIGSLSGLAGLKGASGLSGAAGLGSLGIGGAALGLLGAFKAGQSGNSVLRGSAPAIGAAAGLFGFGALTSLFPSLIALGPAGWIAAAGIGATIGIIGLLKDSAEKKIQSRAKSIYGIDISRQFAKDPLAGIIKQNFGGNIDVGLRSPQVRDLIELYAMSTGQNSSGINTQRPIASSFGLSGGGLSQQAVYQNGISIPLDRVSSGAVSNTPAQPMSIQLDAAATVAFLNGQAIQAIQGNPRVVSAAVTAASQQNASRRENVALALQPGAMVSA